MSEAIAMSSPSGSMSKSARAAAEKRLSTALFGEGGLKRSEPEQPTEYESLIMQAKELRELADRGMKPRAYKKKADELEARAKTLMNSQKEYESLLNGALPEYLAKVQNSGTSEGAKKGWDSRRGGTGDKPIVYQSKNGLFKVQIGDASFLDGRTLKDGDWGWESKEAAQKEADEWHAEEHAPVEKPKPVPYKPYDNIPFDWRRANRQQSIDAGSDD